MGTDYIMGYGHSELPGRVKPDQILASSNTSSWEETFPKRSRTTLPACSLVHPSTQKQKGGCPRAQGVHLCGDKSLKVH